MTTKRRLSHRDTERFDAQYTATEGGKYPARKLPRWRYRPHDIAEYLEMLEDEGPAASDMGQTG